MMTVTIILQYNRYQIMLLDAKGCGSFLFFYWHKPSNIDSIFYSLLLRNVISLTIIANQRYLSTITLKGLKTMVSANIIFRYIQMCASLLWLLWSEPYMSKRKRLKQPTLLLFISQHFHFRQSLSFLINTDTNSPRGILIMRTMFPLQKRRSCWSCCI